MTHRVLQLCLLASLLAIPAHSKNLEGRYGFGVSFQDFNSMAAVSMRLHFSPYASATALVGFDTADSSKATSIGIKLYRNAHQEENMNLYVGLGAFLISQRNGLGNTDSGLELDGLIGGEFFLPGLPNLGLQFETGVAVRTPGSVTFKTIGATFAGAGIHYYF